MGIVSDASEIGLRPRLTEIPRGAAICSIGDFVITVTAVYDYSTETRQASYVRSVIEARSLTTAEILWVTTFSDLEVGIPTISPMINNDTVVLPAWALEPSPGDPIGVHRWYVLVLDSYTGELTTSRLLSEYAHNERLMIVVPNENGYFTIGSEGLLCHYSTEECDMGDCAQLVFDDEGGWLVDPSDSMDDLASTAFSKRYLMLLANEVFGGKYPARPLLSPLWLEPSCYISRAEELSVLEYPFTQADSRMPLRRVRYPQGSVHIASSGECNGSLVAVTSKRSIWIHRGEEWLPME